MKKFLAFLFLFLCFINAANATDSHDLDYRHFGLLPVLHEGRVKPLDTYARIMLREFSGHETVRGHSAPEWLAEVLFDPVGAAATPTFRITSPAAKDRLSLDPGKTLYSFSELGPGLQEHGNEIASLRNADPDMLTDEQRTMLALYVKIQTYSELLRTFSAFLPLSIKAPTPYMTGKAEETFTDFVNVEREIMTHALMIAREKGLDPDKYTPGERAVAELAFAMQEIKKQGITNTRLNIVQSNGQWMSPWQFLLQGGALQPWQDLTNAYRSGDKDAWRQAVKNVKGKTPLRIKIERAYNVTDPFQSAMGFYLLGIIILAAEIHRRSRRMLFPYVCFGAAFALHVLGLLARIIILERPPVGTLYESLLFVSLICATAGLVLHFRRRSTSYLFSGPGSSAFLLFIAPFLLQQGESMEMLVAVLNTNFWLGTHVLCITAGYGVSIITAALAHAWFLLRLKNPPQQKLGQIEDSVYKFSLAALLLTGVGTILGGIWADQSWGRFWGWDPKENGALIIVLWLVWMQHGRVARRLGTHAFMAAAAFLNVVVALAWFGVNLLGVGLHSYGFINGIAFALAAFCFIEILVIGILWRLNVTKTTHALA